MKNTKFNKLLKLILFVFIITIQFAFGYGFWFQHWTRFIISTSLIITTTKIFYPQKWKQYLGINLSLKSIIILASTSLFIAATLHIITYIILPSNIKLVLKHPLNYIFTFFQSFTEELVFRALLLSFILKILNKATKLNKWITIALPAIIFSILHYYAYLYLFQDKGIIETKALITLTLFAIIANIIFINTKNITLPLAFHFGWNSTRFASNIIYKDNPKILIPEYIKFNLMEGSNLVLMLALGMTILACLYFENFSYINKFTNFKLKKHDDIK